jgi:teichuronic acid biosynthesis glycosyltransferase TuaG
MKENTGIKFSVVIPVYNGVATIVRAIDSVLGQSHPPHQIIVVDDASTDDSCRLISQKYAGKVMLLEQVKNQGSSAARNAGMDVATGDYIAFLDADDIWHRDKLKLQNAVLTAQPQIVMFFNRYTQEDINANELPSIIEAQKLSFIRLLPGNFIATSCITLRNDPSIRFEASMRYTEDYDLCLRVCYAHNIYYTDLSLTQIFRGFTTKGGISSNKWKMRKGELRAYSRLVKLNPLFLLLVPFLWLGSMLKHLVKGL